MKKFIYTMLLFLMVWTAGMADNSLPSLCDEWNVVEKTHGVYNTTYKWRLTTDTVINAQKYVKIEKNHRYKGALREDDDANIYFVHPNSTHESLLYAFHAQVGDTLTNTSLGNKVIVRDIRSTTPRRFILDVEYGWYDDYREETYIDYWEVIWIEGVGYDVGTPTHYAYAIGSIHELDPNEMIICAYKNGEQIYMSDFAEIYGCDYQLQDDTYEGMYTPTPNPSSSSKILQSTQILIERGEKTYTLTGQEVK